MFSVNKKERYPILKDYQNAIYNHKPSGPLFGTKHSFCVRDNSNSNTESHVRVDGEYNLPAAANGKASLTDGSENFKTTEIEVYLVQ